MHKRRFSCNFAGDMGKGRNKSLIEECDRRLYERFYYWTEVKRLRIDDTIKKLSEEEFFLSESRVMQIIRSMLRSGAKVYGKEVPSSRFNGFRVAHSGGPSVSELSLFP